MGRELIVASSVIWLLQCRCFWNFIFEHKPKWLIVDDIMTENNHLHYHLGMIHKIHNHDTIAFIRISQLFTIKIFQAGLESVSQ